MKYIINIIKKFLPQHIQTPLGRWKIENCHKKINYKIDLSNEDHCGPCGQYSLEQIEIKNKKDKDKKDK
jgi:hypothetical protein